MDPPPLLQDAEIPSPSTSFDTYQPALQQAILKPTKYAVSLPSGPDMSYQRTMDRQFSKDLDACSERVLGLAGRLLEFAKGKEGAGKKEKGKGRETLREEDVLDGYHNVVIDVMDQLFESVDKCLDELSGRVKAPAIVVNASGEIRAAKHKKVRDNVAPGRLDPSLAHASHLPKPQLKFSSPVDNSNVRPTRPLLLRKVNAMVPLGYISDVPVQDAGGEGSLVSTSHPYHFEITHISYPTRMFEHSTPHPPQSFEDTPFTFVSTPSQLSAMLAKLRTATEIAVDLEHHDYRTYYGFVCLMQISTREEDWVVDTLLLRDELEVLNEVFTDPDIVKVFHGAEMDILWLQQDFNIYIVNLFDTFHASKILEFPRHSLASLLSLYCDFEADKRYQLADWRIRPLPEEMLYYARSDTHFLLFVYDSVRNALLERAQSKQDLVRIVLSRSETTSLKVYERELYDSETGLGPTGWEGLERKWNKRYVGVEGAVFRGVCRWRDGVAREIDESTKYVLPNHFIFQLVDNPPVDLVALHTAIRPLPIYIRKRGKELLEVIRKATEAAQEKAHSAAAVVATANHAEAERVHAEPIAVDVMPDLWSQILASAPLVPAVASSALFGKALNPTAASRPSQAAPAASTNSSLFGSTISGDKSRESGYEDVVARIHRSLFLAVPSGAAAVPPQMVEEIKTEEKMQTDEPPTPEEIPFVPHSQRQPKEAEDNDTIVHVGRAKPKKRKRQPPAATADTSSSTGVDTAISSAPAQSNDVAPVEPFDYSSVPNILDNGNEMDAEARLKKKQKKKKGAKDKDAAAPVVQYGDFPAPPRSRAEPKLGNRSQTFH